MNPIRPRGPDQIVLVVVLAVSACGGGQSGTVTEDNVLKQEECKLVRTEIATDDERAGVSAEELIEKARQLWMGQLTWTDAPSKDAMNHETELTGTIELAGTSASFDERNKTTMDSICEGALLSVPVHSHFGSADGAFAEDLAGLLFYDTVSETTSWKANPLSVDAFRGEMETASFYAAFDDPVLWFSATFEPTLSVQVSVAEGADVPPSKGSYTIAYMGPAEVEER